MTMSGDLGSFDSARKDLFTPDPRLARLSKKAGKSLNAGEADPRPENWFLSSADYGSLRRGERASQPHQEGMDACLHTDRRHPCKQFKMPLLVGTRKHKNHHKHHHHHHNSKRDDTANRHDDVPLSQRTTARARTNRSIQSNTFGQRHDEQGHSTARSNFRSAARHDMTARDHLFRPSAR